MFYVLTKAFFLTWTSHLYPKSELIILCYFPELFLMICILVWLRRVTHVICVGQELTV